MADDAINQEPKTKRRANTLERRVDALHEILMQIYGPERLILRAGKLQALKYLRSDDLGLRTLALMKLVREDPSLNTVPNRRQIGPLLNQLEDELADILARRTMEDDLEKRIAEKMQDKHEDYVRDIRNQILKEDAGPETPETLKRFAHLVKLDQGGLTQSALEVMRPEGLQEVIGQTDAIDSLLAKLGSPYPQHVLLYGPPGVGKTTVARLVLAVARMLPQSPFSDEAPFVEADGTTLRWDPREITNPLLGSVHDPIYQGARRDLAESGIPEPKTGLVTEGHGGVLFIDEIGEMDPILQNKLLKVLEDKRVYFDSPYYDAQDPNVPKYVHKLFAEGAPADFILIGATTRSPDEISPALRSRCAEIYFEPLTPKDIARIVTHAAAKLHVGIDDRAVELVGQYTLEGRKAVGLVADAFSVAYLRTAARPEVIDPVVMKDVISRSRLVPVAPIVIKEPMVGRSLGLAVAGFQGLVLEIEATVFPSVKEGDGHWRFNDTAGSMAKDSVFNAATVLRQLTGRDLTQYDVHVNVVGGGNIDGPSAGVAIFAAVYSALTQTPIRPTVAMTGELSLTGRVKPVGGIPEKIFGARQLGLTTVLVPQDNAGDVPPGTDDMRIVFIKTVQDVLAEVLV
jgi:ATP-dependent Lon protease